MKPHSPDSDKTRTAERGARRLADLVDIPGLHYIAPFITEAEEVQLAKRIDAEEDAKRDCQLSRRVQHYGIRYDYRAHSLDPGQRTGPLPRWLRVLGDKFVVAGYFDRQAAQPIVNEYQPRQGIAGHIDHASFGPSVASRSLL